MVDVRLVVVWVRQWLDRLSSPGHQQDNRWFRFAGWGPVPHLEQLVHHPGCSLLRGHNRHPFFASNQIGGRVEVRRYERRHPLQS